MAKEELTPSLWSKKFTKYLLEEKEPLSLKLSKETLWFKRIALRLIGEEKSVSQIFGKYSNSPPRPLFSKEQPTLRFRVFSKVFGRDFANYVRWKIFNMELKLIRIEFRIRGFGDMIKRKVRLWIEK